MSDNTNETKANNIQTLPSTNKLEKPTAMTVIQAQHGRASLVLNKHTNQQYPIWNQGDTISYLNEGDIVLVIDTSEGYFIAHKPLQEKQHPIPHLEKQHDGRVTLDAPKGYDFNSPKSHISSTASGEIRIAAKRIDLDDIDRVKPAIKTHQAEKKGA